MKIPFMTNPIYKVSAILTVANARYIVVSGCSNEVLLLYVDQLLP